MFGSDEKALCATLSQMHKAAIDKANANQIEAAAIMRDYLRTDRRFDSFDADRLISRVYQSRSNGAVLDLSDPYLRQGGQRRPGDW